MAKSGSRSKSASRSRGGSKTSRGSAKRQSSKGGAKKRPSTAKSRAKAPKKRRKTIEPATREVELRPIREQLYQAVDTLKTFHTSTKVEDAIRRLDACLAEINEICGPDMAIPDPPLDS